MTETITIRLHQRTKSEIKSKARPNVNAWLNNLIEEALGPKRTDWEGAFERRNLTTPVRYCSEEVRRASR